MPGVDLNLDLPDLSDNLATIVSKLVIAISAIEADLEAKVVPSEIYVNQALAMNGAALVNVGSVQLAAGNPPTNAGSIYYSNGEFYAVDSLGVVQLTAGGALDVSAAGTIGGDYGGSNPASVTYNTAAGEYRFYQNVGVWADVVCRDVILEGTNGSVKLGCHDAITGARQLIVKGIPTSGVSLLVYASATSTLEDAAVTRATNTTKVTDIDAAGSITAVGDVTVANVNVGSLGKYKHGTRTYTVPLSAATCVTFGTQPQNGAIGASLNTPSVSIGAAGTYYFPIDGIRSDETLLNVVVLRPTNQVANVTYALALASVSANAGVGGFIAITGATATSTANTVTLTPTTPAANAGADSTLWLKVVTTGSCALANAFVSCDVR